MRSGKRQMREGIELQNQKRVRMLGKRETYKYLGILEADNIKQAVMKEKKFKKYLWRTEKLLETKLYCRNLIKGINTRTVPFVRHLGQFLKWMREKLQQMDQKTNDEA